ncbi:hypothetical protein GVY41_18990 [Frigidibacter albus]|uniref:Uncharacterized protein n=1 Tax=Frigidibacter albus TaxID=1465486 RepID=A0A6L8VNU6_9RHOB|nr:hypothetical protein [Frigidibacter albus]MZQ91162.1 hypothetical protein [Frigidibacter albus]NBE33088.1 hypothetical protein [Frigidibacter albus]GGH63145.1 hypothetical protein GCM10011341_38010 [Frigidibacter albus]
MTTHNFDQAVAGDARLQARFDGIFDMVRAAAADAGLSITADDLKSCPSVKLATFSEMGLNTADALTELRRLPHIGQQAHKVEVTRQLARGEGEIHAELARMNPYQRLNFGRELEAARAAERAATARKPASPSAEDEAKFLLMLRRLPPAERISAARAAGML